jgi:hypothetical protein
VVQLLQIVVSTADVNIRLAAGLFTKNVIKRHWVEPDGSVTFSEADKSVVRENICESLLRETDNRIIGVVCECINFVAVHDFPDKWPCLIPQIQAALASQDHQRTANALRGILVLVKRYEFRKPELRGPLEEGIAVTLFPMVLQIFQALQAHNSKEAASMMKTICKIYWASTQFLFGAWAREEATLMAWMEAINFVLVKPLPEASEGLEPAGQPTDIDERYRWPWWKAKKWAAQVINRVFSRYGHPKYATKKDKPFAKIFSSRVAPILLNSVMDVLSWRQRGRFCTDRVLQVCFCFINTAVEIGSTFKLLKPHLNFLLVDVMFPVLCWNDQDAQLWEEDPHEYCRKSFDPLADFIDPRMSAISVMVDLAKSRTKECLPLMLSTYGGILEAYAASPPAARDYRSKEGALGALGALQSVLEKKPSYCTGLEGLLMAHVVPEFQNPHGYLRARACWMYQQFATFDFKDKGHLTHAVQQVVGCLRDPELPVRMQAACALRYIVSNEDPAVHAVILPALPHLLDCYFQLMAELGVDDVVAALGALVNQYQEQITPYAVGMAAKLADVFRHYLSAAEGDDEEAALAAFNTMETITTLLAAVCDFPDLYKQMEVSLVPLCVHLLAPDAHGIEYVETVMEMLSYMTYHGEAPFTPTLWQIFPAMVYAYETFAPDFLGDMAMVFDNFMARDTEAFLVGVASLPPPVPMGTEQRSAAEAAALAVPTSYLDMVFRVCKAMLENVGGNMGDVDHGVACKLLMSVLHNCRGRVDGFEVACVDLILARLSHAHCSRSVKGLLMQVLASALFYNAGNVLRALQGKGVTGQVFQVWLECTAFLAAGFEQKMSVIGFLAVLAVPSASLPPEVQQGLGTIFAKTVQLLAQLHVEGVDGEAGGDDEEEHQDEEEESDDDGSEAEEETTDEEDEGGEHGFGSEEDIENAMDEAYLKALRNIAGKAGARRQAFEDAASEDGEDEDQDYDEAEDDYVSPIDNVHEAVMLHVTLSELAAREPALAQQLQASLPPPLMGHLATLMQQGALEKAELEAGGGK